MVETDRISKQEKEINPRKVLLFCPEKEFHEIPLLHMKYLLKKSGAFVAYMGVNVTIESLEYYCRHQRVDELYFHLLTNFTRLDQSGYLELLSTRFPDKKIYCGGASMRNIQTIPSNVKILQGREETEAYSRQMIA